MAGISERLRHALKEKDRAPHWLAGQLRARGVRKGTTHTAVGRYLDDACTAEPTEEWVRAAAELLDVSFAWLQADVGSMDEQGALCEAEAGQVVAIPLWRIGIDDLDLTQADVERQKQGFYDRFADDVPQYEAFTTVVRALFGNALARLIKTHPTDRRKDAEWRAKQAELLLGFLLLTLPGGENVFGFTLKPDDRQFTDYAIAMLHALMLAMPMRRPVALRAAR